MEAYCVKCKQSREMLEPVAGFTSRGGAVTKGVCAVCGTKMAKFGATDAHEGLEKPVVIATPKISAKKAKDAGKTNKTAKKTKAPKTVRKARATKTTKERTGKTERTKPISYGRGKELVIVESPAKAKTIGKFLGDDYTVVASVGHVRDLLKTQLSVDVDNDFKPKYRVPNEKLGVVAEISRLAARSKKVYLATDPDREGESIAWHLMDAAGIDPNNTERVVFHEITKSAVAEAFAKPKRLDMDLVDAQQARRVLDRLVGYGLTPILWAKVRGRLSAGRVQSVAVRLVVEREREIQDFVPVEYWTVDAEFSPEGSQSTYLAKLMKVNHQDPVFPNKVETQALVDELKKAAYHLDTIQKTFPKQKPSSPFITSTLQQEASRKLRFNTRRTMAVAQQLYEGIDIGNGGETGLITYMRTDSVQVSLQAINEARAFIKTTYGDDYLPEKAPQYRTRAASAQEAHEAIRPTSVAHTPESLESRLTKEQFRLYKLIWQRFVASQMTPATYERTRIEVLGVADKREYLFAATTSKLIFAGYRAVYQEVVDEDKPETEDNVDLPLDELREGQKQILQNTFPEQHFTQPPPRFSEASLIQVLEENKIGRPSTYSPIISTIQTRGYVTQEQRRLIPTEIGFIVNDLVVEYFPEIVDVGFTSNMEDELDKIADGKLNWVEVMHEFYGPFKKSLAHAEENMPVVNIELEKVGRTCPKCGSELVIRHGKYGKFISCSSFPECRHTEPFLERIGVTCPTCHEGDVVKKRSRKGRTFYGCSRYPDCDFTSWNPPIKTPCPSCGGTLVAVNQKKTRCLDCSLNFQMDELEPQEA